MTSIVRFCMTMTLLLLLSGCYEEKQQIILNPDGSGKAQIEIIRAVSIPMNMSKDQETDFDPETALRNTVESIIEKSEGIDTWKNVTFAYRDDGRLSFRGTAYFPVFSKLNIDAQASKNSSSSGGFMTKLALRSTKGGLELIAKPDSDEKKNKRKETKLEFFKEKIKYQQMRGLLVASLTGLRSEYDIVLPAVAVEHSGFEQEGNSLHYAFDGEKLLALIDRMVDDDELLRRLAAEGKGANDIQEWAQKEMFGADFYARLKGPLANQFNYKKEVAAAKKNWASEKARLFTLPAEKTAEQSRPEQKIETGETVTAGEIQITSLTMHFIDRKNAKNLQLFNDRGWKAKIAVALPAALTDITSGVMSRVIADSGQNLLSEKEWDRRINFPKLSDDGRFVIAELPQLSLPEGFNGALRELSGEFTGMTSSGEKIVNLGLIKTLKESKGTKLGATVTESGESKWNKGKYELSLKLQIKPYLVKEFAIVDEKGKPVEFKSGGSMLGESLTQTFNLDKPWPKKVRIKVTIHDNVVEHKIPFKVENINLMAL